MPAQIVNQSTYEDSSEPIRHICVLNSSTLADHPSVPVSAFPKAVIGV